LPTKAKQSGDRSTPETFFVLPTLTLQEFKGRTTATNRDPATRLRKLMKETQPQIVRVMGFKHHPAHAQKEKVNRVEKGMRSPNGVGP
jgi:hypothetical protein